MKDSSQANGQFPARVDRDYEDRLLRLCTSGSLDLKQWDAAGPSIFMAGLAVMVSCVAGVEQRSEERAGLLALAEELSPGASDPDVFQRWLKLSPVRPSRFLPMLKMYVKHGMD